MSNNTKWKDHLLKTGLPLEFLTAIEFESRGHSNWGEYPYLKRNENGVLTEFSVDPPVSG